MRRFRRWVFSAGMTHDACGTLMVVQVKLDLSGVLEE